MFIQLHIVLKTVSSADKEILTLPANQINPGTKQDRLEFECVNIV